MADEATTQPPTMAATPAPFGTIVGEPQPSQVATVTTDIAANLEYLMNLTKDWHSQNVTLDLAGERVSFVECTVSDGQVFLLFQSEKGNQFLIPPDSFTLVNNSDVEANHNSTTTNNQTVANDSTLTAEAAIVANNVVEAVSKSVINEKVDTIESTSDAALIATPADEASSPPKPDPPTTTTEIPQVNSQEVKQVEPMPATTNTTSPAIIHPITEKVADAVNTTTATPEKTVSGSIVNDLKSSNVNHKPSTTSQQQAKLICAQKSNLLDSFVTKSQNLNPQNSPKTYSRNSNIVWITGLTSDKSPAFNTVAKKPTPNNNNALTTTIEIAEPEDSKKNELFGVKVNKINVNNISKSIDAFNNKELTDSPKKNLMNTIQINNKSPLKATSVMLKTANDDSKQTVKITNKIATVSSPRVTREAAASIVSPNKTVPRVVASKSAATPPRPAPAPEPAKPIETEPRSRRSLRNKANTEPEQKPAKPEMEPKVTSTTEIKETPKRAKKKVNFDIDESVESEKEQKKKEVEVSKRPDSSIEEGMCKRFKSSSYFEEGEIKSLLRSSETREDENFNDYKINCLNVSVRIQPDERHEYFQENFCCENCGFSTSFLNTYIYHRNSCTNFKYFSSSSYMNNLSPSPKSNCKKSKLNIVESSLMSEDEADELPLQAATDQSELSGSDFDDKSDSQSNDDEEEKTLGGFSENDVIWVETKVGFWPALITKVHTTEKKFTLRLIDCPLKKESMKTSLKSVISFNDAAVNKKMLKDCKGHSDQLIKAVQKAEDYLRKRCLGTAVNTAKFFNFVECFLDKPPASDKNSIETKNGDSSQNERPKSNLNIQVESDKILKFIKDSKVETHLIGIYRGSIESERHRNFFNEDKAENDATGFSLIKEEDQQDDLFKYCSNLFKNHFENKALDLVSYIYSVWAPEAIIKAISRVYHVDIKDAEQIFNQECNV